MEQTHEGGEQPLGYIGSTKENNTFIFHVTVHR